MHNLKHPLFLLVDGSSHLYRAFHALPPLTNSKGQPTGAIFGMINMVRRLLQDYSPDYLAIVFDSKEKNFRHELFKDYKAHRPTMPEDLQRQIQPLHEIIRAMGIPLLMIPGIEADDVIGTLAQQATQQKIETLISTGDKDFAQLVSDHISLINTMTNTFLNEDGVRKKFGIPPARIVDYLALVGDSSDNIPGVPKVGPKTAIKWLEEFGSLDGIIQHAAEIHGAIGENLRKALPDLPLMKTLVTLKCDVDLGVHLHDLVRRSEDREALMMLFEAIEFKTWLAELRAENRVVRSLISDKHYHTILSHVDFETLLNRLKQCDSFALDTETSSLNYMNAKILGLSFSLEPQEAFYLPIGHTYPEAPEQLEARMVFAALKPILENPAIQKIGQNIKYDQEVLMNHGICLQGAAYDTMLESYIVDSTLIRHDLDSLAAKYLSVQKLSFEDVTGKGAKQISFAEVDLETATRYAAADADATRQLHQYFWPKIKADEKLLFVFTKIEMPLVGILATMERQGVLIDINLLQQLSQEFGKRMLTLEQGVFQQAGITFNLDSPKQLQEVLYQRLKLPILKKTPTGQPSTAEPILQELALDYPLPKLILEYRSLSKLKSTYTDQLPLQVNAKTGRIHTSYQQAIATTGRLTSTDPNLQNIPIRNEEGKRIRRAFIAPPGYRILAADYSQIELRIMAHLSQDPGLLNAFEKGLDIHQATAADIFGLEFHQVTDDLRRKAKAINFGLIYGMSAFGLAKQIGVERTTAQAYIDAYFAQYPNVLTYMDTIRATAHRQGFVETLFGRKLYIPDIHSKNIQIQKASERAAINAPMQGTAADIIKLAMIQVNQWIQSSHQDVRMTMQVHDELVFEVAEHASEDVKPIISTLMCSVATLSAPLVVDIGIGHNWDEAH